jgi:hypothetical protein
LLSNICRHCISINGLIDDSLVHFLGVPDSYRDNTLFAISFFAICITIRAKKGCRLAKGFLLGQSLTLLDGNKRFENHDPAFETRGSL